MSLSSQSALAPLPLPELSVLRVRGADAADFLQRQLCGDLRSLRPGAALYTGWCNAQGRIISDLLVLKDSAADDTTASDSALNAVFFLVLQRTQAEPVCRGLQRYLFRDRVEISQATDMTVSGLQEHGVYAGQANISAESAAANGCPVVPKHWTLPWDQQRKMILTVTTEVAAAAEADLQHDAEPSLSHRQQQWWAADIAAGVAWLPHALSGQFLPQMLAFEALGAVSYAKGCYPGQEVIARTHYLGQVKRRWALLQLDTLPDELEIGATIYNHKDEDVGVLLAIANDGEVNRVLAVLRDNTERQSLHLKSGSHSSPLSYGESATCSNGFC